MMLDSLGRSSLAWMLVLAAGLLEVVFAFALKHADGFTRLWPTTAALLFGCASLFLLSAALKSLPVGTAYAVWVGIGAMGVMLVGLYLGEPASPVRVTLILVLVGAISGLHWTGQ